MARQDHQPGTDDNYSIGTDDNYSIGTDDNYSIGTDDNYSIAPASERLSVMDWLFAVGHVAARKLRGAPLSPTDRLQPSA